MILPERKVDPPGIYEKPFKEISSAEAGISDLEPDDVTQIPSLWASLIGSEKDWGYRSVQQKYSHFAYENERAYIAQGKVLGGSSSINAQAFVRGSRNNYDQWEHEGAVGWGYDDVLPFFRKLENATDTSYGDSRGQNYITYNEGLEYQIKINNIATIGTPTDICSDDNGHIYVGGQGSNNKQRLKRYKQQSWFELETTVWTVLDIPLDTHHGIKESVALCFNKDYSKLYIFNDWGSQSKF
ncbi:unnamed protein product [Mytilus edulis]|uniref:Glucose-methanol-choline oxidoreductase N-terminal domain-containing protein n=1 Tax=Mytilus edulis TaxID=6550 RepID=A0A8S3SRL4_MYTED|nr:unnamed protein product [Mytilus edulis]